MLLVLDWMVAGHEFFVDWPYSFALNAWVFVDAWQRRSLGGCRYHVSHPGGRHYEHFPVNAYEAQSRRLSRFERVGHTAGEIDVKWPGKGLEMPFTLDLRGVITAAAAIDF